MEEEANTSVKTNTKKRLSPDSTLLLTIGGCALAVVVYRIIYFIVTGS